MDTVSGFFNNLTNATGKLFNSNNSKKNNSRKAPTQSYGFTPGPQNGGMASVAYSVLTQPSQAIMKWATTAGLPTPTIGMRNVAHGGKRRSKRGGKRVTYRNKKNKKRNTCRRK